MGMIFGQLAGAYAKANDASLRRNEDEQAKREADQMRQIQMAATIAGLKAQGITTDASPTTSASDPYGDNDPTSALGKSGYYQHAGMIAPTYKTIDSKNGPIQINEKTGKGRAVTDETTGAPMGAAPTKLTSKAYMVNGKPTVVYEDDQGNRFDAQKNPITDGVTPYVEPEKSANDRTPRSFSLNGVGVEGFADKQGNFYDANGQKVSGKITPYVAPSQRSPDAIDPRTKFGADQGNKILDDFARDTKDFHSVMSGWDVLKGATKDPTLTTPFAITDAYARITNPGALVRPTTMEMIDHMGSLGQRMQKAWQKSKDGQLPPEIVQEFQKTLYNIVSEHKNQYDQIRQKAILRGKSAGTDVEPYLQDYTLDDPLAALRGGSTGNIDLRGARPPAGNMGDTGGTTIVVNGKTFKVPQ